MKTICLGLITALITIVFALIISLANRQNKNLFLKLITYPAGIGYAIPGSVLAITLITISTSQFTFIAVCLLIWGYLVRFLTISKGSIDSALERISPSLDEAANGLGSNWFSIIKRVHLRIPLLPLTGYPKILGLLHSLLQM